MSPPHSSGTMPPIVEPTKIAIQTDERIGPYVASVGGHFVAPKRTASAPGGVTEAEGLCHGSNEGQIIPQREKQFQSCGLGLCSLVN